MLRKTLLMSTLPPRLDAGALELCAWRAVDVDDVLVAVAASFPELHQWMTWAQTMPTREALRQVLDDGERAFASGEDHPYLLRERGTDDVVGGAGLHWRLEEDRIEIGYWVRSDRTGRGYATAAARALTDAAFAHLDGVRSVQIRMDAANVASARVPAKLGYRLLGEISRDIAAPGHTGRGLVWETDRRQWAALR